MINFSDHFAKLFAELLKQFEDNIRFDHLDFSLHDPARNILITHPLLQKGAFEIPGELPVAGALELVVRQRQTIEVQDAETETRLPICGRWPKWAVSAPYELFR